MVPTTLTPIIWNPFVLFVTTIWLSLDFNPYPGFIRLISFTEEFFKIAEAEKFEIIWLSVKLYNSILGAVI